MSVYRVVMVQTIPSISQTYENVVYVKSVDEAQTQQTVAADLAANFCVSIRNFQTWFLGWQFLYVYKLTIPAPPVYQHPMNNAAGLAQVGYLYPTTCLKIRWTGVVGGRHGHGRFYVAGSRVDWATAGGITASAATNGAVHIGNIINRYGTNGNGPNKIVLYSRNQEGHPTTDILTGSLFQYLGQQRSRNY